VSSDDTFAGAEDEHLPPLDEGIAEANSATEAAMSQ